MVPLGDGINSIGGSTRVVASVPIRYHCLPELGFNQRLLRL